jgi:DNA-binding NarL/FixJ family response regulator
MTIRVLLADDQPLIRAGLSMVIADAPDIEVVAEASSGAEAVRLAAEAHADVVVMDIRMPGTDGIAATKAITAGSAARVIMLTTFDEDDNVYASLRAGASGFLVKDMALDDILAAVRVVAAGEALLAPAVTRRLIRQFTASQPRAAAASLDGVTGREREVLVLVGRGMSNGEIAAGLFISVATVKSHVTSLLLKLGARDRIQLVVMAHQAGLV